MRPSKQKTTVAVLRVFLDHALKSAGRGGMGQKEFADLVGKSVSTIQSLESGRLPLSPDLAKRISVETGVERHWLLEGDPMQPMTGTEHHHWQADETPPTAYPGTYPYSLRTFEMAQERQDRKAVGAPLFEPDEMLHRIRLRLVNQTFTELAARFSNHPDSEFRLWKLRRLLLELDAEFPEDT